MFLGRPKLKVAFGVKTIEGVYNTKALVIEVSNEGIGRGWKRRLRITRETARSVSLLAAISVAHSGEDVFSYAPRLKRDGGEGSAGWEIDLPPTLMPATACVALCVHEEDGLKVRLGNFQDEKRRDIGPGRYRLDLAVSSMGEHRAFSVIREFRIGETIDTCYWS